MGIFIDNSQYILDAFGKQMSEAKEEIKDDILDSILWTMMYGYNEPHGSDGHTEIYDTGRLYASIDVKDAGNVYGSGIGATSGTYGWKIEASANTEYASYVHQGTYKLHGRPFLSDGIQRRVGAVKSIIEKHGRG